MIEGKNEGGSLSLLSNISEYLRLRIENFTNKRRSRIVRLSDGKNSETISRSSFQVFQNYLVGLFGSVTCF